jgi:hypothetical protein
MPNKKNARSAIYFYVKERMDNRTINVATIKEGIEALYTE